MKKITSIIMIMTMLLSLTSLTFAEDVNAYKPTSITNQKLINCLNGESVKIEKEIIEDEGIENIEDILKEQYHILMKKKKEYKEEKYGQVINGTTKLKRTAKDHRVDDMEMFRRLMKIKNPHMHFPKDDFRPFRFH